jgi:hypothetical protein
MYLPTMAFKISYLYLKIANFEQPEHRLHSKEFTEKSLLDINKALVMIWRKQLPPIISHSHIEMLFVSFYYKLLYFYYESILEYPF